MLYSDGTWQASRRAFPTVGATLVRRTPLRLLFPPLRWQRRHYLLDERPDEPVPADTMLGAFILLRRAMLDEIGGWDAGFRMYCEDIDLNYRAARAGWERWYVPAAVVRHEYAAVIDKKFLTRHTFWHARAMAALSAEASGAPARAAMTSWDKYSGKAQGWSEREYASPNAYLSHRADLVRTLGPALRDGDVVLDLACGDGALADFLPDLRYVGVDASEEMVAAGRERGRELVRADLNDYAPAAPVQATTVFRAIYYARDRRELFERIAGYTERKLVFDLNPRQYRLEDVRADLRRGRLRPARHAAVLRSADARAAVPAGARAEHVPAHGCCCGTGSPSCVQLHAARKLREEAVVDVRSERARVGEVRIDVPRNELVDDHDSRAESRVRRAHPDSLRLEPLRDRRPVVEDSPERGLAVLRRDRRELDVHRSRGPVLACDPDPQPAGLRSDEAEVRAVVRAAPSVGVDAAALRAEAVRLREPDQSPLFRAETRRRCRSACAATVPAKSTQGQSSTA